MAYTILIVDDSETARAALAKALSIAQTPVREFYQAADGQAALALLEDKQVDIVFLNLSMPGMNGLDMLNRMKERGLLDTVPVVVVSADGSETRITELAELGIRGHVRKPYTPERLKARVDKLLGAMHEQ
ncbi:MAG TPA: response regulator [Candidatus Hydrogenedentes bacterium]|nr:response regulator [Candidatus Hydrogenedentota bacterium]